MTTATDSERIMINEKVKKSAVHFDFPSLALRLRKLWAPLRCYTHRLVGVAWGPIGRNRSNRLKAGPGHFHFTFELRCRVVKSCSRILFRLLGVLVSRF